MKEIEDGMAALGFLLIIGSLIALLVFAWFMFKDTIKGMFESQESKNQRKLEEKKRQEERELWSQKRERTNEFENLFGFSPELMIEDRYKKEVLLKLGFIAKKLYDVGEKMKINADYYQSYYDEQLKEYMEALEVLKYFDPQFQKEIPHWTELPRFVEKWLWDKKIPKKYDSATVEC